MRTWGDFSESFRAAVKANLLLGVVCMAFGFWLVWLEGTASGRWYEGLPQILMTVAFGDGILCLGLALLMFAAKKTGSNLLFFLYALWAYGASAVVMIIQAIAFLTGGSWEFLLLIPVVPFMQVAHSYQAYRDDSYR